MPLGKPVEPLLALPALVNAHDHGRAVRTSSVGAGNKPLESWLLHLALIPSVDPYLAAVVALGNAALGGAGAVMMHYTRAQGFTDLPTEAAKWRGPRATSACASVSPSLFATAIRWFTEFRARLVDAPSDGARGNRTASAATAVVAASLCRAG